MAAERSRQTAYKSNTYHRTSNTYVQGNTVRKLSPVPVRQPQPVRKVSRTTRKNRDRALHMNISYVMFLLGAMIAAGVILTSYLSLQSDITNSIKHISALERELNDMRLKNDEDYSRISSNVNAEEVRKIAIQELGMQYAAEGQIIAFNGEGSDYVRQTGEIPVE